MSAQGLLRRLRNDFLFPVNAGNLALRADQLRTRMRFYPTMLGGQALLVVLFAWLMWDAVPHSPLLWWCAASYTVYAADLAAWLLYRDRLDTIRDCARWHIAFSVFTAAGGLMWGSAAWWLFPPDAVHRAELIMVLLGLSAASVTTNPSYPSSLYIYALSVVMPLALRLALIGDDEHWALALIVILYLAVVLKAGNEFGRAFRTALQQRHENLALVGQLTEQKTLAEQARQEAEAANKEKSRFLAAASHDLRQPLQALTLFSNALTHHARDGETGLLANRIELSVRALSDMFDEMLDLSRLDAGMLQPRLKHFAVLPLLDRLYVSFAPLAQAKGLGFEVPAGDVLLPGDPVVYSDPFLLERMLRNLLSNAIRYTDSGGVTLCCRYSPQEVRFEVGDTGIGIQADAMPHIFEEYYQADNPHRDRRKGLGLGLAIVRRIEKLLEYRVEVNSEPGRGSVFSFGVPTGDTASLAYPFAIMDSGHDLSAAIVALVEDDPDIRDIAAELMAEWGCRVFAGETPEDVITGLAADAVLPDLIICDYRLPRGLTSTQAIARIREQCGSEVPAMVLTGDTGSDVLGEIRASGAILLHKPVTAGRLRALMHLAIRGE